MNNILTNLTLRWDFAQPSENLQITQGIFADGPTGLMLSQHNFASILEQAESPLRQVVVLGSPILDQSVDRKAAAQRLAQASDITKTVAALNGEFLVIAWHKNEQKLQIFTDRFSAYPIYWACSKEEFCCSYAYIDLVRHCRAWPGFSLRPDRAYEFFSLNRLLGTNTHDTITQGLPPATCLTVQKNQAPSARAYWQPNYSKNTQASRADLIDQFSDLFSRSVQRRSAAQQKTGVFLSGGHDSRLVATYLKNRATCFTLSFHENLEVECARKIAHTAGHDHVYCAIDSDFFEKTLDLSTELSGALYATDNALFLYTAMNPAPQADIFLHGHGLDYMYQGMYLHAEPYRLFGRNTYIKHFSPFPADDFVGHFLSTVPIRMKYDLRHNFLNAQTVQNFDNSLHESADAIYQKARTLSDNPHDHWEYMILHQISKHHTFSNVLSKRTCGELRTPSLDNDLYNFYLALPHQYRLHGDIIRGGLYKGNPKVANMFSSNHGLPAGWGPYKRTGMVMARKLLRHATLNRHFRVPEGKDRTWPDRTETFRTHDNYRAQALAALEDREFQDFIGFIDWPKLKAQHDIILNQHLGGAFLAVLMSYHKFFKAIQKSGMGHVRNHRLSA